MKTDAELHDLLRRTFDGVAGAVELPDVAESLAPRRPHRWLVPAAAAAVVVAAIGGVVIVTGGDDAVIPLTGTGPAMADYQLSTEEVVLEQNAYHRMLRDCMGMRGQPYRWDVLSRTFIEAESLDDMWPRLGRTDARRAATIGYRPTPAVTTPDPNRELYDDPGHEVALWGGVWTEEQPGPEVELVDPKTGEPFGGQSSGGCFGQVWQFLYGDQSRFTSLSSFVNNSVGRDWSEDPRLRAGMRAWRECMDGKGHDVGGPFDPIDHYADRWSPEDETSGAAFPEPSAEELATATDDVACKESSGLLELADGLRDAYSREAAASEPVLLAEYRQLLDDALVRATAFEAGKLRGPWREDPWPDAPANSATCTWIPDGRPIDLSAGEREELRRYRAALLATIEPDAAGDAPIVATDVVPPPWILDAGDCTEGVTVSAVTAAMPG